SDLPHPGPHRHREVRHQHLHPAHRAHCRTDRGHVGDGRRNDRQDLHRSGLPGLTPWPPLHDLSHARLSPARGNTARPTRSRTNMTSATTPASYTESLFGLEGQLAVVTGASQGIGLAITAALASAGADIIAVSRSMPEGDSQARTLVQALGRKFTPLRADFSVREQVIELAEDLAGRGVDILVNNARAIRRAPAAEHCD